MFGKLMKYELRYLLRIFAPMWGFVIAICALGRVAAPDLFYFETEMLSILLLMTAVIAIVAMMVISSVVILQRFYKGMYGDEGYLMFTLPVSTSALIHAKGLSAMLMMAVTAVVTIVGYLLLFSYEEIWTNLILVGDFIDEITEISGLEAFMGLFWLLAMSVAYLAEAIYSVYLAISLGQLWRKHPVAGAILAYYGLSMVLGVIQNLVMEYMGGDIYDMVDAAGWVMGASDTEIIMVFFAIITVICLAMTGIYFIGTKLLMDKKLNIA